MFQTLILVPVAKSLMPVAEIKVWNIKISNVKNILVRTSIY